jgi:transposase
MSTYTYRDFLKGDSKLSYKVGILQQNITEFFLGINVDRKDALNVALKYQKFRNRDKLLKHCTSEWLDAERSDQLSDRPLY